MIPMTVASAYRRGASAPSGVWTAKTTKTPRAEKRLGTADDAAEADASLVLAYGGAVEKAWRWFRDRSGVIFQH
jgi:hypothetical protein